MKGVGFVREKERLMRERVGLERSGMVGMVVMKIKLK